MDSQRQPYIPGPPPFSHQQSSQNHMVSFPPPPPRIPHPTNYSLSLPPPPGPPPPVSAYGVQPWHQQGWARQQTTFPPPPPGPHPMMSNQAQPLGYGTARQAAPLSAPSSRPSVDSQPLTSATYIPDGESFGPGVGIPPLFSHDTYDSYPHPEYAYREPDSRYAAPQTYSDGGTHSNVANRTHQLSVPTREQQEQISMGPPTATLHNPQPQEPNQAANHQHSNSVNSLGGMSSQEANARWPLERVLLWLAQNGFSNDWQETFKTLDLHGADFIELGRGANGRGNLGKMHQVVYPQLAKECTKSGTGWDQPREREEGKRMRKLIRRIADSASFDGEAKLWESTQFLPSASTDGGVESSPNLGREVFPAPLNNGTLNQRRYDSQHTAPNTGGAGQDQILSESGPDNHARSDYSRMVFSRLGERRKHSPSTSSDTGVHNQENLPQSGSPAAHFSALAQPDPGAYYGETNPSKRNSSDSMSRGFSHSFFGGQGSAMRDASRSSEHRKPLPDGTRASPQEGPGRQSGDTFTKEHSKGILNMFRKKKGQDSMHPSPEEGSLESPTSPMGMRHPPASSFFSKPAFNASDMSIGDRPPSTVSDTDWGLPPPPRSRGQVKHSFTKRYVFATLDGWNYRLIDVTDVDAADTLRARVCNSLGIQDPFSALIYLTEPGQLNHEEPLSDTMLVVNRRAKSDAQGSLKLLVYAPAMSAMSAPTSQSAGLGLSFVERTLQGNRAPKSFEDEVRRQNSKGVSPSQASAQLNLSARSFPEHVPDSLLAAPEEHKREAERKQRAYLQTKQEQNQKKESPRISTYGIKREGVIDFDSPRVSPYEEKKTDNLVPLRKPPLAPSESNMLTKVNSLSKPSGNRSRNASESHIETSMRRPSESAFEEKLKLSPHPNSAAPSLGLGAALVSAGKMSSSIGKPSGSSSSAFGHSPVTPSEPTSAKQRAMRVVDSATNVPQRGSPNRSSRPPSYTWGKGDTLFKVPSYKDDEAPKSALRDETKAHLTQPAQRHGKSPSVSPASSRPGSGHTHQSRKSYGPDFDFEEAEISFSSQSPQVQQQAQDSDDDSDEGLFAIPLANGKTAQPPKKKDQTRVPRPALTVNTGSRSAKTGSVAFRSPLTADIHGGPSYEDTSQSASDGDRQDQPAVDQSTLRKDPPRLNRPESIIRDDIWASRPPVEGMIDRLDDFFPGVDLDEPYLEGSATTPPLSPVGPAPRDEKPPTDTRERLTQQTQPESSLPDIPSQPPSSDVPPSDESTIKPKPANSVAQRNVNKSGGLTRMKSIREVARGAHQVHRNQSRSESTSANSGAILRRKSTKMFGAKIMQISPKPGRRLSQLDPIPQNNLITTTTQNKLPQRQPTFRIIRGQLIGNGTYGRVYLGINADTGEILAVKQVEVNQKAAGHDQDRIKEMVAALDQEIDTMQHLEHPNIVQYLGCERGDFSISIYLEYIPGGSIGSCLRKHGKFEESVVKSLTIQVLSGLAYLHDQGILHRDLKADNILLDLDGTAKISDFGISKKTDNIYGNDVTNSMQGSVFWMAPEVVQSQGQGYSAKVDIWSLGCVVLEMFAGRRPWSKEEAIGAIFKLGSLNQAPPIPDDVSVNISPAALAFMYDCFTIDTYDRPTATTLLSGHPFCIPDPDFNFLDTELHAKIRHVL